MIVTPGDASHPNTVLPPDPLGRLSRHRRVIAGSLGVGGFLLFGGIQESVGGRALEQMYTNGFFGRGIVAFETAPSAAAIKVLTDPHSTASALVLATLPWDFPFIASYVTLLAVLAIAAAKGIDDRWEAWGRCVAWAAVIAGACDCVENCGLYASLYAHASDPAAAITASASWSKWGLLLASIVFILIAGSLSLIKRVCLSVAR